MSKSRYVDRLICVALLVTCFVLVRPTAEAPRGDDFSYAMTALQFARTGHFVYNAWATAAVGWEAVWGAAFIHVFGFSQTILRVAMLVVSATILVLFHAVLTGFGIGRRNAMLGTLTLGLTPVFLDLTASFMTDLPGLVFLLLCAWMCQRAAAARTDRQAYLWLAAAVVLNLIGGTVRQTTWLGSLVMVPSTGWMRWKARGWWKAATVVLPLLVVSFVAVLLILHWCDQQPYFVPEKLLPGGWQHLIRPANLIAQPGREFATLTLFALPVGVSWLVLWYYRVRALAAGERVLSVAWLGGVAAACACAALVLERRGTLNDWIFPWNPFNLINLGAATLPVWVRVAASVLPVLVVAAWVEQMLRSRGQRTRELLGGASHGTREAFWILGPFSAVYSLLLIPRGLYGVFDRYLLVLLVGAIAASLLLFERQVRQLGRPTGLPLVCIVPLVLFGLYGVGSVHDALAQLRAMTVALQQLQAVGVPRDAVSADMGLDAWVQVNAVGHVNFPVPHPAETFHFPPAWTQSTHCEPPYSFIVPVIHPQYILMSQASDCFPPSRFAGVAYRAWLPPFERNVRVDDIR